MAYERGVGVPARDPAKAAEWYAKAAAGGDLNAQDNLGVLYERGEGVPKDLAMALRWYSAAAAKNHPSAQNNVGVMLERGNGVPADVVKAAAWYRRAAGQNHAAAQNNLGVLYGTGRGVKEDLVTANFWFTLAARGGSVNGATNRDATNRKLNDTQRAEVQQMLARWQNRNTKS